MSAMDPTTGDLKRVRRLHDGKVYYFFSVLVVRIVNTPKPAVVVKTAEDNTFCLLFKSLCANTPDFKTAAAVQAADFGVELGVAVILERLKYLTTVDLAHVFLLEIDFSELCFDKPLLIGEPDKFAGNASTLWRTLFICLSRLLVTA